MLLELRLIGLSRLHKQRSQESKIPKPSQTKRTFHKIHAESLLADNPEALWLPLMRPLHEYHVLSKPESDFSEIAI